LNKQVELANAAGASVCVVLLPYEMQISRQAAETYRAMGFRWEDGFEQGSAQQRMAKYITPQASVYDPMPAFAPYDGKVGSYYVYNLGDKVDWNHPNGAGHKLIAEAFMRNADCPFLRAAAGG
jgi:hypothetical protein